MYPSLTGKPTSTGRPGNLVVYQAGGVCDGAGVAISPGAVAVRDRQIAAVGSPEDVCRAVGEGDEQRNLPDVVLIPALVNAHVHLQMTTIGPATYPGDFADWVMMCRRRWQEQLDRLGEEAATRKAIKAGVEASRQAGVMRVGDVISWNQQALAALRDSTMSGVGYLELVGIGGEKLTRAMQRFEEVAEEPIHHHSVALGLEPHAPYSTGPDLYAAAVEAHQRRGVRLTTHLAEMQEELQFVAGGNGPFRDLIARLGRWDECFADHYGQGETPVQWLDRCTQGHASWLCAHCNYVNDPDIALIADRDWSVAYCPRASDYFGHTNHRYRDMLAAGINVALGTDSIVCHGTLSIVDEMRHLYRRDRFNPAELLTMATVNGMKALQSDPTDATFAVGRSPGLVALPYDADTATDPLAAGLLSNQPPTVLEASQ